MSESRHVAPCTAETATPHSGRKIPASVTIASSRMSVSPSGTAGDLLRRIGEAERLTSRQVAQRRDRAVVEPAAIAEPVPARVEGEHRHQEHVRLHRLRPTPAPRCRSARARSPPRVSRRGTAAAGRRASISGTQVRNPSPASASIAGRGSSSPRIGRYPATAWTPRSAAIASSAWPAASRAAPGFAAASPARSSSAASRAARLRSSSEVTRPGARRDAGKRRARRDRGGVQSLRAWLTRWAPDAIGQGQSQSRLPQECLRPLGFGPLTGRLEPATCICSAPAGRFEGPPGSPQRA